MTSPDVRAARIWDRMRDTPEPCIHNYVSLMDCEICFREMVAAEIRQAVADVRMYDDPPRRFFRMRLSADDAEQVEYSLLPIDRIEKIKCVYSPGGEFMGASFKLEDGTRSSISESVMNQILGRVVVLQNEEEK